MNKKHFGLHGLNKNVSGALIKWDSLPCLLGILIVCYKKWDSLSCLLELLIVCYKKWDSLSCLLGLLIVCYKSLLTLPNIRIICNVFNEVWVTLKYLLLDLTYTF